MSNCFYGFFLDLEKFNAFELSALIITGKEGGTMV